MDSTASSPRPAASAGRAVLSVVAACLACLVALALAGCGQQSAEDAEASIRAGIDADMQTLASLDTATASQLFASEFTTQLTDVGIDPASVYGPLFSSLTYTINGIDVDMDTRTAVAHLTITNKNLGAALLNYQSTLTDTLASSEGRASLSSVTEDDAAFLSYLTTELQNAVNDPALGTVTTNVDVTYRLQDSSWVATNLDELQRALLGGLDTTSATSTSAAADGAADAAATPEAGTVDTGAVDTGDTGADVGDQPAA